MTVVQLDGAGKLPASIPGQRTSNLLPQPIQGSPEALDTLRTLWRRAGEKERFRISVFGASHTSADFWTGRIRRVLQDRHGDLGHGFILPAALYKGYRGSDINLCRTNGWLSDWVGKGNGHKDGFLGFGGMSVSSADPQDFGWAETTRTNPHGRSIDQVHLFAMGQKGGGTALLEIDDQPSLTVPTAAQSPQLLWTRVNLLDGPHRVTVRPKGDGPLRLFGFSLERAGRGALVDAIGIRGRQARTWLEWNQEMFHKGLRALDPDLVILAYGTNEANRKDLDADTYRDELRKVLDRLRGSHETPKACLLVGPSDRFVRLDPDRYAIWTPTRMVAEVQKQVAAEYGCGFWDWQKATGGPGSMLAWRMQDPPLASGDGIHHTRAGYERIADFLIAALDALAAD